jgi:hypothetical protein
MLRHLGLIAVCACIVASVGCDGAKLTAPDPRPSDPNTTVVETVTVEFGGRVVNADTGGPVESVRVSLHVLSRPGRLTSGFQDTATSGGDGTFTLPLNLPSDWRFVFLNLTGPPGYDDAGQRYERIGAFANPSGPTAADRPAIRLHPTLVIRPGESIEVRVESDIVWCGFDGVPCRRVLVAASPGDPVELEVVPRDSSKPMALGLAIPENPYILEPDMSVRRLMVPPGAV